MKVCTDSCLFGAWMANKVQREIIRPSTILDIGSGTGLLGLMMAQKIHSPIDAVEIDENSYGQTVENFIESPWSRQLHAFQADIKSWNRKSKYDLIISNPPFYENNLKATQYEKNVAKHNDGLTLLELLRSIKRNLADNGNFAILLPFHRATYFTGIAIENGFYLTEELLVKQTPTHSFFRSILFFGTQPASLISDVIIIKDKTGNYTQEFNFLLKDYYLEK